MDFHRAPVPTWVDTAGQTRPGSAHPACLLHSPPAQSKEGQLASCAHNIWHDAGSPRGRKSLEAWGPGLSSALLDTWPSTQRGFHVDLCGLLWPVKAHLQGRARPSASLEPVGLIRQPDCILAALPGEPCPWQRVPSPLFLPLRPAASSVGSLLGPCCCGWRWRMQVAPSCVLTPTLAPSRRTDAGAPGISPAQVWRGFIAGENPASFPHPSPLVRTSSDHTALPTPGRGCSLAGSS